MSTPLLEAHDIHLGYEQSDGTHPMILQEFSLHLQACEVVANLGTSGVGKSSLLRVMAGLQPNSRDSVR